MDYFKEQLQDYAARYFPHLAEEESWLRERCERAGETFERQRQEGESVYTALEQAHETLFGGLDFSLYELIHTILCEDFTEEVLPKDRKRIALQLLPSCDAFLLEEGLFLTEWQEESDKYQVYKLEVTGRIAAFLQQDGL